MLTRPIHDASSLDIKPKSRLVARRRSRVAEPRESVAWVAEVPSQDDHEGDIVKGCAFACVFGAIVWIAIGAAIYSL